MLRLLLALSLLAPLALSAQEAGIAVGSTAPDVALQTLDAQPVRLSQWIGKRPVLLEFWASWCGNCKQLESAMTAAHRKYGAQVEFVGVAVSVNQTPERVRRYVERYKLPLRMLYDRDGDASEAYEVPATSYVVVIDRSGKVVYTGSGGTQNLDAALARAVR